MKNEFKKTLCLLTVLLLTLSVIPGGVFAANAQPDQKTAAAPDVAIEGQSTMANTVEVDSAKIENPTAVNSSPSEEKIDLPQLNNEEAVVPQTNAPDTVQGQMTSGNFYYTDVAGGVSITYYYGSAAEVVIPDTLDGKKVVEIGSGAFYYYPTTSIIVGNNVKTIKANAFTNFYLNKIVIPPTTTVIDSKAFAGKRYSTLKLYGKKGSYAETYTPNISNALFIDIDQPIPAYFYENINGGVKIIAYNGSDSVLTIPTTLDGKSVVAIGAGALKNSDFLTQVIIPDSVTTLEDGILRDCDNLEKLTLGKGVSQIPSNMANTCLKLREVVFNGAIVSIGSDAFNQCPKLEISKLPETLESIGSGAFYRCTTLTNLTIPDKTTTIGSAAFVYCEKLENVTLGNSLTTLDYGAFSYCNSLKEVTLPKSLTTIKSGNVFVGCPVLAKVVIPDTTTSIAGNIFERSPLTKIYGSKGSYAQTYAATYSIPFVENQPSTDVSNTSILYRTHVQNYGWQGFKKNGDMSGTSNEGLRLEAIEIKLDQQQNNLSVEYQTHVQNYGWQKFMKNGEPSGTSNEGLRLEAIRIKLSGADANKFDIYYRVHAENVGWMGWAKNGADAGTAGYGYRLEGIEIKVLTKGSSAPGSIENPFLENK